MEKQLIKIPVLGIDVDKYDIWYARSYVRKCFDDFCLGLKRDEKFGRGAAVTFKLEGGANLSFGALTKKGPEGKLEASAAIVYDVRF